MNFEKSFATIRSLFNRLLGSNGSVLYSGSNTVSGVRYHSIYVGEDTTFTAVTGGGSKAESWLDDTVPAGSLLTTPAGCPVTGFTISSGKLICY